MPGFFQIRDQLTDMNTYLYEVTYRKNGEQTYEHVRAVSKEDAIQKVAELRQDIAPLGVSRIGN